MSMNKTFQCQEGSGKEQCHSSAMVGVNEFPANCLRMYGYAVVGKCISEGNETGVDGGLDNFDDNLPDSVIVTE